MKVIVYLCVSTLLLGAGVAFASAGYVVTAVPLMYFGGPAFAKYLLEVDRFDG